MNPKIPIKIQIPLYNLPPARQTTGLRFKIVRRIKEICLLRMGGGTYYR